jgi:monovalent cation:H+ antiporter-2, CPA2 family
MLPDFDLTELALVALVALSCGILLERFRQPAVLGYILAGVILGPSVMALVENREHVAMLAELGVLMLLFVVGIELSLEDFKKTWHISLFCTVLQVVGSLGAVLIFSTLFHLPFGLCVLLAFAVALSSTAVAVKMLEGLGELSTSTGQLTIGILIAQDLAVVPMMIVLRNLGADVFDVGLVIKILLSLAILGGIIWALGRREQIKIPFSNIVYQQPDLVPLVNIAICLGFASLTGMIGLSAAYGAFLAGLILGNTDDSEKLVKAAKPVQSILMMVFFLSIGLLMDLSYIWEHMIKVILLLLMITVGKSLLNVSILHILGQPWHRSFLAGLLLAQMGEFAFVLTTVGSDVGIVDESGKKLIISLAALSLAFSPFWLAGVRRLLKEKHDKEETFNHLLDTAFGHELKFLCRWASAVGNACLKVIKRIIKRDNPNHSEKA